MSDEINVVGNAETDDAQSKIQQLLMENSLLNTTVKDLAEKNESLQKRLDTTMETLSKSISQIEEERRRTDKFINDYDGLRANYDKDLEIVSACRSMPCWHTGDLSVPYMNRIKAAVDVIDAVTHVMRTYNLEDGDAFRRWIYMLRSDASKNSPQEHAQAIDGKDRQIQQLSADNAKLKNSIDSMKAELQGTRDAMLKYRKVAEDAFYAANCGELNELITAQSWDGCATRKTLRVFGNYMREMGFTSASRFHDHIALAENAYAHKNRIEEMGKAWEEWWDEHPSVDPDDYDVQEDDEDEDDENDGED